MAGGAGRRDPLVIDESAGAESGHAEDAEPDESLEAQAGGVEARPADRGQNGRVDDVGDERGRHDPHPPEVDGDENRAHREKRADSSAHRILAV